MKRIKAVVVLAAASAVIALGLAGCKHHGDHEGPRGSGSAWADGGHPHFHGDGGRHHAK